MPKFVGGIKLPPVSAEFIKQLDAAFAVPTIEPGYDKEKVMFAAGQRSVITWIKHHATGQTTVTGDVRDTRAEITTPTGAVVKHGT